MDGGFIRKSALVGAAQVTARALGILFSFVVARYYIPAAFGEVRYLIALASILVLPTTALPRVLSRFVTKHRGIDQGETDRYFTNSLALLGCSLLVVLAATLVVGWALHRLSGGLIALCVGTVLFAIYFDLLRAVERFSAMALFYIAANVLQLLVVVAAALAHIYSVPLVVTAYGLSCVVPLLGIEWARRSPITFRPAMLSRRILRELAIFSLPMLLAHAAYTAWFNCDLLLVEHYLGLPGVGNYALAKTLALGLVFVPYAMTTVVLPRFVHAETRNGAAYLRSTLVASAGVSAVLFLVLAGGGPFLLRLAFHHKYPGAALSLTPLSAGMALYAMYSVLEAWVISIGRPFLHAVSMLLAMIVTLGSDLVLIPMFGQVGAGSGFLLGAAAGLTSLAVMVWATRPNAQFGRHLEAGVGAPGPVLVTPTSSDGAT